MIFRNILVAILTLLLGACATPIRDLSIKDNFTANSLKNEKMVFGGISSSLDDWTEIQIATYSDIARNTISDHLVDVQVNSPTNLIEKLGKEEFYRIQQEFAKESGLSKESIVKISELSSSPRYIMFSRLDIDYIDRKKDTTQIKGENGKTEQQSTYKTSRDVVVSTKVYDLISSDVVLSGVMRVDDSHTNFSPHYSGDFLSDLLFNLLMGNSDSYPEPPSLEGMFKKAFAGIAEGLPHKSCNELGVTKCVKKVATSLIL